MERKSFERGTVVGGIVRVLISVVAIVVASIVMATAIRTWEADEAGGKIFQCVIAGILILAGVVFIINGVQMIRNGKKSFEVTKKGHSERGRILDLTVTEVTENNNGAITLTMSTHFALNTRTMREICVRIRNRSARSFTKKCRRCSSCPSWSLVSARCLTEKNSKRRIFSPKIEGANGSVAACFSANSFGLIFAVCFRIYFPHI